MKSKQELLREENRLASLEAIRMQNMTALCEKQVHGATVSDIALYDNYIRHLTQDLERQLRRVIKLKDQVRQKCSELIEAMKERKMLDRLKERELETYRTELSRKEQRLMNEIAINKFNMRNHV